MTRQAALRVLWKRLLVLLIVMLVVSTSVMASATFADFGNTGILVFMVGNIGGYVGMHRSLGDMTDDELAGLAESWWSLVAPSVVGGVLALVLYVLFMSGILGGDLFPKIRSDQVEPVKSLKALALQHAEGLTEYAKLFFWSFVGGFNQKYVVDVINSVRAK